MSGNLAEKLERENITLAKLEKRIIAHLIDDFLISVVFLVIYWDAFGQLKTYEEMVAVASNLIWQMMLLHLLYQTFFTWYYGGSMGKIMMKIVCIDTELLDKPGFTASLIRAGVRVLGMMCFYLGFAWALSNPLFQTWQDKAANTVVINAY